MTEMALAKDNHVVNAFPPDRPDQPLRISVIQYVERRCLTCSADLRGLAYGATIRDMGTGST